MTPAEKQRLRELCETLDRLAPAPWSAEWIETDEDGERCVDGIRDAAGRDVVIADSGVYPPRGNVAEFIAAARSALPDLLAENERLRALAREAIDIAVMSMNHLDRNADAKADRLAAISKELPNV